MVLIVIVTSFSVFHRMKEDFMGLYLVREQFQSDMCLVKESESLINTFLSVYKRMIIWSYNW